MSQNVQIDLNDYRYRNGYLHFVGCGGVGTGPLMRILHQAGFRVSGSDLRENSITRMLKNDGMRVEIEHRKENLPPEDGSRLLLIRTSAAAEDNPELLEAERRGAVILRRGEALGIM